MVVVLPYGARLPSCPFGPVSKYLNDSTGSVSADLTSQPFFFDYEQLGQCPEIAPLTRQTRPCRTD